MIIRITNLEAKLIAFGALVALKDYGLYRYGYHKGYLNGFDTAQAISNATRKSDDKVSNPFASFSDMLDDIDDVLRRMNEKKGDKK